MPLRIGLDARAAFLDPHRGLGRVARSLADALLALGTVEVVVFVPHRAAVPPRWYTRAARVVRLRRPRRGALLADGPSWAVTLRRHPVDVLHLPAWGVPPLVPVPVVATFHDATPMRLASPPGWWPRQRACLALRSLRRARVVHAVSAAAAAEAEGVLGLPAATLVVVHWGVGPPFVAPPKPPPAEHLLYVGGADRHKNLALLLEVVARAAGALPPLLVAGPAARDAELARRVADAGLGTHVHLLPERSDEELAALYSKALATVLPSRNEGFGLPLLEAMACGSPVVAGNTPALVEVGGSAAEILDCDDVTAWLGALTRLAGDRAHRQSRRRASLARAADFSWEATAAGLVDVYRRAVTRP